MGGPFTIMGKPGEISSHEGAGGLCAVPSRPSALPPLRAVAGLGDVLPVVVVDTREQSPLPFANCPTAGGTLATGDYSVQGFEDEFTVERKSLDDLAGSCTHDRQRFEKELVRMRGYPFRRLLVVGTVEDVEAHRYRSRAEPKAILASVTAFEIRYGLPVAFCPTPGAAALQIERWALYFLRERLKTASAVLGRYAPAKARRPHSVGGEITPPEG